MITYKYRHLSIFFSFLVWGYLALAQSDDSFNRLFESNEILKVSILSQIDTIRKDVGEDFKNHKAVFSYKDEFGKPISLKVKLSTRGHFRKDPKNCDFPPLKVYFNNKETKNTLFEGHDWLKIVTHCMNDNHEYEQFVLQEYMVYRLYNIISPYSFRVRLLDITYKEENFPEDSLRSYAFIIERPKHVAERNGGEILNVKNFAYSDMEEHNFTILSLFQYMIINNDWSVSLLQNIKLITIDPFKPYIPVPYDFDWAGIINTPYRMNSNEITEKNNNSDRLFKGINKSRKEMEFYFRIFNSKKSEIYNLYKNFHLLDSTCVEATLKCLDEFYYIINHSGSFRKEFRSKRKK
jgi:hypothetical protein